MLLRASCQVRQPQHAAGNLARLLGARTIKAPSPPFPVGSWFVCVGDKFGTLIEVLPRARVTDKDVPAPRSIDELVRERTGTRMLVRSPLTLARLREVADTAGWPHAACSDGSFDFTSVRVDDAFLIDVMTPEQSRVYAAYFGRHALDGIDRRMRALEQHQARVVSDVLAR
jgi:hypothetical protein